MQQLSPPSLRAAHDRVVAAGRRLAADGNVPVLIALDGASGSGKTTLAASVAETMNAALVLSDDFYCANITNAEWDECTAAAKVERCIDWRRIRAEAIEPLLAGRPARWRTFVFEAVRADGTYPLCDDYSECAPADAIVLDGAYSTRPELADLIHLSVLVDVPIEVRHRRLAAREDGDFLVEWHARWDEAEHHYFTNVRPPSSFDLVVGNP